MGNDSQPTPGERRRVALRVARRQVVTLAMVGLLLLLMAGIHYGWANIFPAGWWRP